MKQIKEKIIHALVNFGKWHKRLACVFMAVLLFMEPGIFSIFSGLGVNVDSVQEGGEVHAASGSVSLKRLSGSGQAFMYYNFNEVKSFVPGTTYAFMDGVYGPEDAVAMLGSGAVLKAISEENDSKKYIRGWYGTSAAVEVYVTVITKGKGFDGCPQGGLYKVPNSGTPTEYRYFCWRGGAQNAGPLYAYSYDTAALKYENVSATLKDVGKKGSKNPADYTVKLSYDGKNITLSPSSYSIQMADPKSDRVTIIVEDNDGNKITTEFQCPFTVQYEGNADGVTKLPAMQSVWKGSRLTLSSTVPVRSGYILQNWKDSYTGTVYSKGQSVSLAQDLKLQAQWKDTQAPVVDYALVQVVTRTTDAEVKALVEKALTITDNEPVSECTTDLSVPSNIARSMGNPQVTVTVTDKAGNKTVKKCTVNVVARPVEFQNTKFTESTKKLSATLYEPGSEAITETGFVWGVMNNPTLTLNNGKAKTSSPVTAPNGTVSVTAAGLAKGVTYYARAYATAGGITYYSDEITFGLGLPKYGTFTIMNNGNNTFTVSRESDATGEQTVYYRTVNGSAAGGTHFEHQAGTLEFGANETSKTITVTEKPVTTAYSGKTATSYSNADRTYSVELYRVTGGAGLGASKTATRTMTKNGNYTIDRSVYNQTARVVLASGNADTVVSDCSGSARHEICFKNNRKYNTLLDYENWHAESSISDGRFAGKGTNVAQYLSETAGGYKYSGSCTTAELDNTDGYGHIWIANHRPNRVADNGGPEYDGDISLTDSTLGNAKWTKRWDNNKTQTINFPNSGTIDFAIGDTAHTWFAATGADSDRYRMEHFEDKIQVYDKVEPKALAIVPMAGGLYKVGDSFTVAVIFDEIVDKTNSSNISSVSLATTWGPAGYAGGTDTNVLYFTGTVSTDATSPLKVTSIMNPGYIKDMCNDTGSTSTASKSGDTTASVDTAVPNLSVTSKGVANGAGTAVIKVNTDQSKTTGMRYAWSDSGAMPATGWLDASTSELTAAKSSGGLTLGIRKAPGSGAGNGKWYLHVIGAYGTTGATTYQSAMVDFGTVSSPAAGAAQPTLSVSADNTNWTTQRTISVSAKNGETLKYRKMGDSAWTNLAVTAANVTVTENGYYTFLLTAGDQTVTKNVLVEKIDKMNPKASVGTLIKEDSKTMETGKAGIYTKLTLPVTYGDSDSGVTKMQYAWTNSTSTPASSSWKNLSTGTTPLASGNTELTYTATETTETTKYLHIKVTDQVGHTYTTKSAAYKVIAKTKVENTPPNISIMGKPTEWTNDSATLKWQLESYAGKDYVVTLPDGRTTLAHAGNLLATQNGTYTVTVEDVAYGASRSASLTVDKIDTTSPDVKVTGVPSGWKNTNQTISFSVSDNQSGVGKGYYKFVNSKDEIPTEGLEAFSASGTGAGKTAGVTASGAQNQYLYYKWYDNTGDDSISREANKTEGFLGPIQIDTEKVGITFQVDGKEAVSGKAYPDAPEITVALKDSGISGGIKSVTYQVGTAGQKTVNHNYGTKTLTEDTFTIPKGEIPDGEVSITVRVTDHAGNSSAETYSFEVYNNSDIQVTDIESPVYDGEAIAPGTDFKAAVNGSKEMLNYQYKKQGDEDNEYSGGFPKDAGTYTIKASVAQDETNHYRETERVFDITIQQKEAELTWSNTDFIYNGTDQKPTAAAAGLIGDDKLTVTVTGAKKDSCQKAGVESYTATADGLTGKDGTNAANYKLPAEKTTSFTIEQKPAGLTWSNTELVYNRTEQKPTAIVKETDLIGGDVCRVTVIDGGQTEACSKAGVESYTAKAAALDNGNYCLAEKDLETAFIIKPKPLTAEDITISIDSSSSYYLYTGNEITPKVMVKDEAIVSGLGTAALVQDGDYTVGGTASETNYGTYSLSVNGIGNYTDSVELTWHITDPTDPTGTITLTENKWTKFWNDLTFGLFFNKTTDVTITGEDVEGESGLKDIYYYVSERELTESEVNGISEEAWTKIENGGTFSIDPDRNVVIYAKITDNSGRTAYINSDGIVLDATAPVIIGVADGGSYCAESGAEITFTVSEPNLEKVTLSYDVNGMKATEDLTGDNGVYTLPAKGGLTLTATDKAGNESRLFLTVYRNHVYGEWITKKQETCEEEGVRERICRICGKIESENIPAGHVWEVNENSSITYTVDKESGCTTEGVESQHCKNCMATQKERTIPAAGHGFGEWKETTSECTGSIKFRICEKCGIMETESTVGGHAWEENITIDKAATCTEDGSKSIHCSRCSATKDTEIIPAAGHKTAEMWTHQTEEHYHICSVCGTVLDKAAHRESNWIIEKEASSTENGTKKKICTVCGRELEWGLIPAGGSAASGSITKKVNVKKDAPVEEITVAQDVAKLQESVLHEEERKAVLEEGTDIEIVIEANSVSSDQEPNSAQMNEIVQKAVEEIKSASSLSGEELVGEPGLIYIDLSMYKRITVIRQETDPENGGIILRSEERVEDVYKVNGAVTITLDIPADIYHPQSEAYVRKFAVVRMHEGDSGIEIEALPVLEKDGTLTFDTDRFSVYAIIYQDISACAGGNHTWEETETIDKAASCTENGSKSVHCKYCGEVKDIQMIPAAGHKYGDWRVVKEATAKECGEREKVCRVCGNVVKEEIPALGEDSDNKAENDVQIPNGNESGQAAAEDRSGQDRQTENTARRKSQAAATSKTGDESRPFFYLLIAALSGLGAAFFGKKKKEKQ